MFGRRHRNPCTCPHCPAYRRRRPLVRAVLIVWAAAAILAAWAGLL